ncbi:MAG: hypothetical protein RE472_08910 [Thermoplasmatales archaeon]|nr:MAG: hypothetical protein RE472_08910 [Thermoplasmatales archaeon]
MIAIVKIIIIAVIVVGVAAPTSYVAYSYLSSSTPPMTHFIPERVSAIVDYKVNNTNFIVYASNTTAGVILNYNLSAFENTAKNSSNTTANTVKGSNVSVKYYMTYESYNIYRVSNISLSNSINLSAAGNLPGNATSSIYVAPIGNSFIVLSNLSGVKMAINANHTGKYLKEHQSFLAMKGSGISFYVNLSALDYSKTIPISKSSGVSVYSNMFSGVVIYGNVSAKFTNITITGVDHSLDKNISLITGILPSNLTVTYNYNSVNGIYSAEFNVGFANYRYVATEILSELGTTKF